MSGWQRIGIVISVVWCVGILAYWWLHRLDEPKATMQFAMHLCTQNYETDTNHLGWSDDRGRTQARARENACMDGAVTEFVRDAHIASQDWPWVLGFCGLTLALGWVTGWIVAALTRWIARGFAT